jgi:hypothetical protein
MAHVDWKFLGFRLAHIQTSDGFVVDCKDDRIMRGDIFGAAKNFAEKYFDDNAFGNNKRFDFLHIFLCSICMTFFSFISFHSIQYIYIYMHMYV